MGSQILDGKPCSPDTGWDAREDLVIVVVLPALISQPVRLLYKVPFAGPLASAVELAIATFTLAALSIAYRELAGKEDTREAVAPGRAEPE